MAEKYYKVAESDLTKIADAIRLQKGSGNKYKLKDFEQNIKTMSAAPSGEGVTFGYEKKTITNTFTAGEGKCFYNGVELPEIPADVLAEYPYAFVGLVKSSGKYQILASTQPMYVYDSKITRQNNNSEPYFYCLEGDEAWTLGTSGSYSWSIDSDRILIWSNHDIRNGSATATDIYLKATEEVTSYDVTETVNVPVEREENYSVNSADLSEIMKRIQKMVGTSKQLTIEEAIEQLDKIVYVPQGRAISSGSNISTSPVTSNGFFPTIYYGVATSLGGDITSQASTASGFLIEEGV